MCVCVCVCVYVCAIFNDKIDCELPSIAFDITEWVFIDYNEYEKTLEENNKDITD